jgi:dihydrofolate synthase / folylpolyglutamate synthase
MLEHEDRYQSILDYLYSYVDLSLTRNLRYSTEKFNLERMRSFVGLLGNPHLDYPIVHVAGTKGKGSICSLIANVLLSAKYKVGLYTSPHLQEFTERIKVNNHDIEKGKLINLVEEIKPVINIIKGLSTFEITTALAFLFFSRIKVDIAVIEVGLGGRLDATNVVHPIVSVISTISKDHVKILGNSLEKIAKEKAGIIKNNVPVILSKQKPRVQHLLHNISKANRSPVIDATYDYQYQTTLQNLDGQDFILSNKNSEICKLHLPLLGAHQIENAITAYSAIQIIKKNGFAITDQNIYDGFANVKWPARFEILSKKPLIIIDSAHNTDSIQKLVNTIKIFTPIKNVILIFGTSEDKDVKGMLKIMIPIVKILITTQSIHPRALDSEEILSIAQKQGGNGLSISSVDSALQKALENWDEKSVIIATGSIFIASAIRELWISKYQKRLNNNIQA